MTHRRWEMDLLAAFRFGQRQCEVTLREAAEGGVRVIEDGQRSITEPLDVSYGSREECIATSSSLADEASGGAWNSWAGPTDDHGSQARAQLWSVRKARPAKE